MIPLSLYLNGCGLFPAATARSSSPPSRPTAARRSRAAAVRVPLPKARSRSRRGRTRSDGRPPIRSGWTSMRPPFSLGHPELAPIGAPASPPPHTVRCVSIVVPSLSVTWPEPISLTETPQLQLDAASPNCFAAYSCAPRRRTAQAPSGRGPTSTTRPCAERRYTMASASARRASSPSAPAPPPQSLRRRRRTSAHLSIRIRVLVRVAVELEHAHTDPLGVFERVEGERVLGGPRRSEEVRLLTRRRARHVPGDRAAVGERERADSGLSPTTSAVLLRRSCVLEHLLSSDDVGAVSSAVATW